jgi:hypothetical protein
VQPTNGGVLARDEEKEIREHLENGGK